MAVRHNTVTQGFFDAHQMQSFFPMQLLVTCLPVDTHEIEG